MLKSKENRLNEKFELMFNDYVNGNLFDFQTSINKLSKINLIKFMLKFLNFLKKDVHREQYDNIIQYDIFIDCLQRCLTKNYR